MIDYKLAKELKDAGFPQNKDNEVIHPSWCTGWEEGNKCGKKDQCRIPTLLELIEACGDEFLSLTKMSKAVFEENWKCEGFMVEEEDDDVYDKFAKTPEEVVAKLYIALNKKSK